MCECQSNQHGFFCRVVCAYRRRIDSHIEDELSSSRHGRIAPHLRLSLTLPFFVLPFSRCFASLQTGGKQDKPFVGQKKLPGKQQVGQAEEEEVGDVHAPFKAALLLSRVSQVQFSSSYWFLRLSRD